MTNNPPKDFFQLPAALGTVTPAGWLLSELVVQKNGLTGHIDALWDDLGSSSGWLGGNGENWERGPYYLDGLVPLAYALDDEMLKQKAQKWIEWMLSSADETGFFGPADNLDWWPRMVALKVLTQYHEATGDPRVLSLMDRYFRFQLKTLPNQPLAMWAAARGQEQLLPMLWLYRQTGADYLPELANLLREQTTRWSALFTDFPYKKTTHSYLNRPLFMLAKRGTLIADWTNKRLKRLRKTKPQAKPQTKAQIEQANASAFLRAFHETHSVNLAMALKMPALDALFVGGAEMAEASRAGLDALDRYHGLANGVFSGDEHLNGRSPAAGAELCLVAELMYSLQTLLAITGDAMYADRLEEIAFNAWPGTFTADMCAHQYVQQVNQVKVSRKKRVWYDAYSEANLFGLKPNFGCCAANMHQGWPKLIGALWMTRPDGAAVGVYAPCSAQIAVHGVTVRLSEETDYPFDGSIHIRIGAIENEPNALEFTLYLRVPQWAGSFELKLNGEPVPAAPVNGYLALKRIYRAGDTIELTLLMEPRVQKEAAGGCTVRVGALLMALPVRYERRVLRGDPPFADVELLPRSDWRFAIEPIELSAAKMERSAPGETPFADDCPPLVLRLRMARVPERSWPMVRHSAGPVPPPFAAAPETFAEQTLVPYGCARLRIAQFPIVNVKEEK
ncbi:MAG TPA: beta-L-arabinofuranosidase domain-containing protein [Candidatus Cryosericum sp.]|nr:beta-L-arabinofuranosidase domain-containing protein [Candidatus Cryosericum sp.]